MRFVHRVHLLSLSQWTDAANESVLGPRCANFSVIQGLESVLGLTAAGLYVTAEVQYGALVDIAVEWSVSNVAL